MAHQPHAGHAGCSGGGRGGCGGKFPKRNEPGTLPCKGGEVGACKDLEGNVFTIGSGNKGKGKTGKYTHLVGRSWKIPFMYVSLIPGVVFSSYRCLDNDTRDNVPKGKDGDVLHTSKEKLALYIGTTYGDDVCQEWLSEKQLVLQEPTYPDAVLSCRRPSRYVPYKGTFVLYDSTFGVSDQGQTLDV
jgi:hypothetical protein